MKIRLRLFALAKDLAGRADLDVELRSGAAVADLRREIVEIVPAIAPLARTSMFAVASQYVSNEFTLKDGDEVACIPPVSGG
jgi:molybdopterin converting factor small subunit